MITLLAHTTTAESDETRGTDFSFECCNARNFTAIGDRGTVGRDSPDATRTTTITADTATIAIAA